MTPRDRIYVEHMLDTVRKIVVKTEAASRADFDADENLRLARIHLIQILGEAARRVSPAQREARPDVPWSEIVGMRHKVVHDYFGVDEDIVWQVVTVDAPQLVPVLDALLQSASDA